MEAAKDTFMGMWRARVLGEEDRKEPPAAKKVTFEEDASLAAALDETGDVEDFVKVPAPPKDPADLAAAAAEAEAKREAHEAAYRAAHRRKLEAQCRANGGVVCTGDEPERPPAQPPKKDAYATVITNDGYAPGALALLQSLRASRSAKPRLVLVTSDVSERSRRLLRRLATVVDVEPIPNPHTPLDGKECWARCGYTKLALWGLTEYTKLVYVDADAVVLENVDELFALDVAFAAAPDIFPPDKFNSGVMVLAPSKETFDAMLKVAPDARSHDGGDGGFLNEFFDDWFEGPVAGRLAFRYNCQRTLHRFMHAHNAGFWDVCKPIKVLHFASVPKPWQDPKRRGELDDIWWSFYEKGQPQRRVGSLAMRDGPASLDLRGKGPTALPLDAKVTAWAPRLRVLLLCGNGLLALPEDLGRFTGLTTLAATRNKLEKLPQELFNLAHLEVLMLSGNRIRHLPEDVDELGELKTLTLTNNRLSALPTTLRSLAKLSTLALAGNAFTEHPPVALVAAVGARISATGDAGLAALRDVLLGTAARFVAIGAQCDCVTWLDACRSRKVAYPLDWGNATPKTFRYLLERDFDPDDCFACGDFVPLSKNERTSQLLCDPMPLKLRVFGDDAVDQTCVNAFRSKTTADDGSVGAGVHRYAYNVKTKWASFHDFHFDEALEAQTRVFEKHARRLLRLHATLASAEPDVLTCFVYRAAQKGSCGSFMNCPHSGAPLDGALVEDLVACCDAVKAMFPAARFKVLYLYRDAPDPAGPRHEDLLCVDGRLVADDDKSGLLQFLLWQSDVAFDLRP
ncbi:glycosyl transferase [Aureococcus anophagefferens]|nr:glycosyl transferase [Aureococcus anophagefferens]